jgi:hypothetical protein
MVPLGPPRIVTSSNIIMLTLAFLGPFLTHGRITGLFGHVLKTGGSPLRRKLSKRLIGQLGIVATMTKMSNVDR